MLDLIKRLNEATAAYNAGTPYMTDSEWDNLYFELESLEKETGITYPHSPTQSIPFDKSFSLSKVSHNHEMLSLNKTKDIKVIQEFLNGYDCIAMGKLDGLTCSLTYENGILTKAETRGDGKVGEDVLHNVKHIENVPLTIAHKEKFTIDGEVICPLSYFNTHLKETFKNPRNYAAGALRKLDSTENINSGLTFVAWDIISNIEKKDTLSKKLLFAKQLGFSTVSFVGVDNNKAESAITKIKETDGSIYPLDGVVFKIDLIQEYEKCGYTNHHPKGGIAFKFQDAVYETQLKNIEWQISREGVLTPVAVFDAVEIDGSTIQKASLHNLSVLKKTLSSKPYSGQIIYIEKKNQIIPQVVDAVRDFNLDAKSLLENIKCPKCGASAQIQVSDSGVENFVCLNMNCIGKTAQRIIFYCGNKGLKITGLGEKAVQSLCDLKVLSSIADIYKLKYIPNPSNSGISDKIYKKIIDAIEERKRVPFYKFLSALGIDGVGESTAIKIATAYPTWKDLIEGKQHRWEKAEINRRVLNGLTNFDFSSVDFFINDMIFDNDAIL